MTFPTVRSSTTSVEAADATAHDVLMAPTIFANDLLVVGFCKDGAATHGLDWDDGQFGAWTLREDVLGGANLYHLYLKIATGSEDGGILAVTTTSARQSAHFCYAITGWSGNLADVEDVASATGADANPNPPSITPSWGSADNLYIAIGCGDKANTVSVYPYTTAPHNQLYIAGSGGTAVWIAACSAELTGTSQDPGTFTKSAADPWIAHTIVIKPGAGFKAAWALNRNTVIS